MDYKTKIKRAQEVADQLLAQKSLEAIKSELKSEGLYERDITNVIFSARKILGEKYQPTIEQYLLENKSIQGAEEFQLLDDEVIERLVHQTTQKLALEEKKKVTRLVKEGYSEEEILEQVDTRFLSAEDAEHQIASLEEVKQQNSGSGRMLNIFGGLGLIVLTGVLMVTIDRLFYVLPVLGLVMIFKGLTTKRMEYEN